MFAWERSAYFSYLGLQELAACKRVCRDWRASIKDRHLHQLVAPPELYAVFKNSGITWEPSTLLLSPDVSNVKGGVRRGRFLLAASFEFGCGQG
mmetsp:Transcript_4279/g.8915  ORF Transcript_4279/g.8915 Transcript_4279/m.8915 type:complete len:94 (-) Transcript_4279:3583-3864(-)